MHTATTTTALAAPRPARTLRATTARAKGARERRRVQGHIASAEKLARARDLTAMDPLRALVRTLLLEELASYRCAGVFPHNADFLTELRPYFVDARGVRCAMAHLLEVGGEGALVARIASERNNAYVRELADEPRLLAWLDAAGITVEEAAAIQPGYSYLPTDCVCGGAFQAPQYQVGAAAVLEVVTTAAPSDNRVAARVRAVYGETSLAAVGDTVFVREVYDPALAVGTVMLAPVGGRAASGAPIAPDAGVRDAYTADASSRADLSQPDAVIEDTGATEAGVADAGATDAGVMEAGVMEAGVNPEALTVNAVPLSAAGTYTCRSGSEDSRAAPLTVPQFTSAVRMDRAGCVASLKAIDPAWGETVRSGCSVSPAPGALGGGAIPPSTLGVLVAIVGALAARRVARSMAR